MGVARIVWHGSLHEKQQRRQQQKKKQTNKNKETAFIRA